MNTCHDITLSIPSTRNIIGALATGVLLFTGSAACAQSGGDFEITSFTIDNGGDVATGGDFTLVGVIGQPDAGPTLTGGDFSLTGGFLFVNEEGARVQGWSFY